MQYLEIPPILTLLHFVSCHLKSNSSRIVGLRHFQHQGGITTMLQWYELTGRLQKLRRFTQKDSETPIHTAGRKSKESRQYCCDEHYVRYISCEMQASLLGHGSVDVAGPARSNVVLYCFMFCQRMLLVPHKRSQRRNLSSHNLVSVADRNLGPTFHANNEQTCEFSYMIPHTWGAVTPWRRSKSLSLYAAIFEVYSVWTKSEL